MPQRLATLALASAAIAAAAPAAAAEVSGFLVGATAEERVQDDALFGGGRDLVTVVSPEIGYAIAGPRLTASLRYDASLYDYLGNAAQFDVDHRAFLHLDLAASRRVRVKADATLQRVTDPLELDRLGVPRIGSVTPVVYSTAALEVDDRLNARWTARFGYEMQLAHFETAGLVDGSTHAAWAAFGRALSHADVLSLEGRGELFTRYTTPEAYAETPSLDWHHRFSPAVRLELAAGPTAYQELGSGTAWVPYAAAGLVWALWHGELELRAGRDLVGATGFGILWADYVEGGWSGRLSARWSARLGGTYFVNGLAPAQAAAISGWGIEGALDFEPARGWKVEAAVDHVDQTTGLAQLAALDLGLDVAAVRVVWQWGADRRLR